jgi:hypothetical protein
MYFALYENVRHVSDCTGLPASAKQKVHAMPLKAKSGSEVGSDQISDPTPQVERNVDVNRGWFSSRNCFAIRKNRIGHKSCSVSSGFWRLYFLNVLTNRARSYDWRKRRRGETKQRSENQVAFNSVLGPS